MIIGSTPLSQLDIAQSSARHAAERALLEHLLLFVTMSIKGYGENVPLGLRLKLFGERGLEALIERKAIRFVLWTPLITHLVTKVPGVNALQSGNISSPSQSDPVRAPRIREGR
jgi:hypothetical protein